MTADKTDPHEAAEPGHRPADPASGGGQMSASLRLPAFRSASWSSAARAQANGRISIWRPAGVLAGVPDTPPWTKLSDDGERATFLCRRRRHSNCIARKPPIIATISRSETPLLWVIAAADRGRSALRTGGGHGGSGRRRGDDRGRRSISSTRCRCRSRCRRPIAAFVAEHHVEQVFVKRKRDRANPEALARRGPPHDEDRK